VKAPRCSFTPVGAELRVSLDHLTLGLSFGGVWGAELEETEKEACKASETWGRALVSWGALVFGLLQRTRFPFAVHFAAEMRTWVDPEWSRLKLMVAQMSEGFSLMLFGQV